MDLKTYIETTEGVSQRSIAAELGVSPGMVSHYVTGRHPIPSNVAVDIERITAGKVPRHESCPELFDGYLPAFQEALSA